MGDVEGLIFVVAGDRVSQEAYGRLDLAKGRGRIVIPRSRNTTRMSQEFRWWIGGFLSGGLAATIGCSVFNTPIFMTLAAVSAVAILTSYFCWIFVLVREKGGWRGLRFPLFDLMLAILFFAGCTAFGDLVFRLFGTDAPRIIGRVEGAIVGTMVTVAFLLRCYSADKTRNRQRSGMESGVSIGQTPASWGPPP